MKIHLITNLFYPDQLAGASLFTDLAEFLAERGHDIRVTTTFAYYPAWKVDSLDQGVLLRCESFKGIPIRRLKMYVPEVPTGSRRVISEVSFLYSILRRGKFPNWSPDVVITSSPMFSQSLALRLMYNRSILPPLKILIIQDFAIDAALELGIIKLAGLKWFLANFERWVLAAPRRLITISPDMFHKLQNKVANPERVFMIPNWIHRSLQSAIDRIRIVPKHRNPRTLFYSGNVGIKQGLPGFVKAFVESGSDWRFQIQGAGADFIRLNESCAHPNISLTDIADEDTYLNRILSSAACLVTQRAGVTANFLPSKLLPAMATGTPVLAVCDNDSPLAREVLEGGFGEVIPPDNGDRLSAVLNRWSCNPELMAVFSENALIRAKLYQRDNVLLQYEALLKEGVATIS